MTEKEFNAMTAKEYADFLQKEVELCMKDDETGIMPEGLEGPFYSPDGDIYYKEKAN